MATVIDNGRTFVGPEATAWARDKVGAANGHAPRALTGAGRRIDLADRSEVARHRARHAAAWQEEAWSYFDAIAEVAYAYWYLGNCFSRIRLYVATQPDPDAPPIPLDDEAAAETVSPALATAATAALERLRNSETGIAGLMYEFAVNLGVAGECYLVGRDAQPEQIDPLTLAVTRPAQPEVWDVKSVDELEATGDNRWYLRDEMGKRESEPLDPEATFVCRLWQRHPRRSNEPWSLMRSILEPADELLILSRMIRAVATNRIALNGIWLVNQGLSFGQADPTAGDSDGEARKDAFLDDLLTAAETAIQNEGSAQAAVGVTVVVPHNIKFDDAIKHLPTDRPIDPELAQQRDECLKRIERGLPVPVEVVEGHQSTTFANAAEVTKDTFSKHVEPPVITTVQSLTNGLLWPQLAEGFPLDEYRKVMIWYDPSDLVTEPDQSATADALSARKAISLSADRRMHGVSDTDAPTTQELLLRTILERGQLDPATTATLLAAALPDVFGPDAGGTTGPDLPPVPGATGEPDATANGQAVAASAPLALTAAPKPKRPARVANLGRRLTRIDQDLRRRLQVAADAALRRALEMAGSRLRKRANATGDAPLLAATAAGNVSLSHVVAHAGRGLVAASGLSEDELLAEAFDSLGSQFESWTAAAQDAALRLVTGAAAVDLAPERLVDVALVQAADREGAWVAFRDALTNLAAARLYDPSPAAAALGEVEEGVLVPAGYVRAAVARAGGNGAVRPDGLSEDGSPALGIGGGPVVGDVMGQVGFAVEGYEWEYGVAPRKAPFPPHEALDGVVFTDWTDPVLAIDWPGPWAQPGDHDGCLCDVIPTLIDTEALAASAAKEGV